MCGVENEEIVWGVKGVGCSSYIQFDEGWRSSEAVESQRKSASRAYYGRGTRRSPRVPLAPTEAWRGSKVAWWGVRGVCCHMRKAIELTPERGSNASAAARASGFNRAPSVAAEVTDDRYPE